MTTNTENEAGNESERDKWRRINAERRATEAAEAAGHWESRVIDWGARRTNAWANRMAERKDLLLVMTGFMIAACIFSDAVWRGVVLLLGLLLGLAMLLGLLIGVSDGFRSTSKKWRRQNDSSATTSTNNPD